MSDCLDPTPIDEVISLDVTVEPLPYGASYADLVCKVNELIEAHNRLVAIAAISLNQDVVATLKLRVQELQAKVVVLENNYLTLE